MSSNVTIIAPDLKRAVVKATPGTYLSDLLQQACTKLGLNSDNYQLKHGKKAIDLSLPFRLSGLSAGAKLDLVFKSKTASVVNLTLQLPSGERIPSQFPSNFSIWQILRQYESGKAGEGRSLELTQRGYPVMTQGGGKGQLLWEMPTVTIVQRELNDLESLKKTLSQLGFNAGPILLKLNHRKTNIPLHEAMAQVQAMFADQEGTLPIDLSKPAPAHSKPAEPNPSKPRQQPQTDPSSSASGPSPPQPAHQLPPDPEADLISFDPPPPTAAAASQPSQSSLQPTHIFAAPSSSTPAAARLASAESETTYTPTAEHAAMHQHRLQHSSQNTRLLSDPELRAQAAAKAAKLSSVKNVDIRVRFPDNTSADWTFGPADTGKRVYDAVRTVLRDPGQKFRLALPPPDQKSIRDEEGGAGGRDLLIKGYELRGKVLLNFVVEGVGSGFNPTKGSGRSEGVPQQQFLKPEFVKRAEQVAVPDIPEAKDTAGEGSNALGNMFKNFGANVSKEAESAAKKLPKWFKTGKK